MNKSALAVMTAAAMSMASSAAMAEDSVVAKVGAEAWWVDTEVNEIRRDKEVTPSVYAAIEHDIKYVPNARIRTASVDNEFMAFDKLDLTLYYQVMEHDLLHFDAGITFSDMSNTKYKNAETGQTKDFNELLWAFYGYAEITVPDTNFDIIGEMNFGDSSGIKSTDLMAGMQYRMPLNNSTITFRGGYRVIDLESDEFKPTLEDSTLGKPFIMANGFFLGAEYSF
ncbi:TIGR04219 family outer membrane beta-barrel protein [Vibrio coralliilyticus]|uniref:TIGR04219 family outer membrane beta-barrel protein n=1 Tax=Vibrio coralliilyticus TaxID=190893 RepID=UPI000BAAFDC6|nr:TIGR04219 family outer membrane beta-barrel protein [Vibrio coralliilyticus]NOI60886.1 TIGR04219 family outer membrane beta-barrel protein [Vibrio coralliilyticus]PAT65241.1 iron-hydroxamate ABC transporter substrate-binding protein [Vibrio coralliilyticus]